ncbi:hypothetical protein JI721_12030 [Alicyclobacillus cycloheptanicus]|uniref:Uncharacterized protein n=1 Tax=Alicyclobacillus cycloheptanicus TaxID=1457 RepID=A0ABT9XLT8_9BACL|nr:hypothetical protein [Alicyclobacillus cycloheptanicus]MDQ0191279.1 hypothetical protein [Alicyclobacillus cycloheptanicus]WDM00447.1 hypothetical protein JI721_12030 [Alicyclobacillus cycloheptanicus]
MLGLILSIVIALGFISLLFVIMIRARRRGFRANIEILTGRIIDDKATADVATAQSTEEIVSHVHFSGAQNDRAV